MNTIFSFSKTFENKIFRIPDYQRGYSWGNKELEDFWNDLNNTRTNNKKHFTGNITLSKFLDYDFENLIKEGFAVEDINRDKNTLTINDKEYQLYNIVDGQQRFTTILILLYCLIEKMDNPEREQVLLEKYFRKNYDGQNKYLFGYHIDVPSRNFLVRNIFNDNTEEQTDKETLYTSNLQKAKEYFHSKIYNFHSKFIKEYIDIVENNLLFHTLILDDDMDISTIFETMNFRGKQLSSLERLKNRVLYLLKEKKGITDEVMIKRRKEVNDTWLEVYRWLGKKEEKQLDDDDFLKAFWIIEFSFYDKKEGFKDYKKTLFNENFKDKNSEYIGLNMSWLQKMRQCVKLWFFINNPYDIENDTEFNYQYTPEIQRSLYRISHFPNKLGSYMQVLILAILRVNLPLTDKEYDEQNIKNIENALKLIEKHNIMHFLLNGNRTNYNRENIYRLAATTNRNSISLGTNSFYLYRDSNNYEKGDFSWDKVVSNIRNPSEKWNEWVGKNFLLEEYEEALSGKRVTKKPNIKPIYSLDISYELFYDINAVLKENRTYYMYSIGNLLITTGDNKARDFESLKEDISKTRRELFYSEKEIIDYPSWTKETIKERGRKILDFMLEKWEIPKPSEKQYNLLLGHNEN